MRAVVMREFGDPGVREIEDVPDPIRLPPGLVHEEPLEAAPAVHDAVTNGTAVGHTVLRVSDSVA